MALANRKLLDKNVQLTQDQLQLKGNAKSSTNKHKATERASIDELKDGPSRPKRAALTDLTKALSTALIDSTKKSSDSSFVKAEVFDFDQQNANDPNAVSDYASDIFKYFKYREQFFTVGDYLAARPATDASARSTVVDWLVEVQEAFEMNHETLYTAVKLMDMYFYKRPDFNKSTIQLVAMASVFIAAKMEERSPPLIEDLTYLCKSTFSDSDLKRMERDMLKTVGFDLSPPLSYSFLRRYGRVIKADMHLLTTARYALELSLHFLGFCRVSDSRLAAAALLLALRVTKTGDWSSILVKYSGYELHHIEPLMESLNHMILRFPSAYPRLRVVLNKYKHTVFFEVAKQTFLPDRLSPKSAIGPPANAIAEYTK